jgi:dihydroorotase
MEIKLKSPLDMHLHLRDNEMLKTVAPLSAKSFSAAVIMPNLIPPITDVDSLQRYENDIKSLTNHLNFTPLMTLFFQDSYDFEFLKKAKKHIFAIKLYPEGITTNSQNGVSKIDSNSLKKTLSAMSELDIPLLIHGESNGFVMDRESEFIPVYEELAVAYPDLKIVMEHITTKDSIKALEKHDNLYATITLHHLYITLDDVAGGLLKPHLFCKPIAKRPSDREALLDAALNAHPKVMFGSDSAPHPQDKKEAPGCAAGVFTAPIALQALTELFDREGKLNNLQKFVSNNAVNIHNLTPPTKEVTLEKKSFLVPNSYENVVPMFSGEELGWSIKSVI